MKHKPMYVWLTMAALASVLTACGGGSGSASGDGLNPEVSDGDSALRKVSSEQDFLNVYINAVEEQVIESRDVSTVTSGGAVEDTATNEAAVADGATEAFSTTYTVDADVDEFDIVKYNGEHLFVAKSVGYDCCFAIEPLIDEATVGLLDEETSEGSGDVLEGADDNIRILATDTSDATAEYVSGIQLDTNEYIMGMYLHDNALVTVGSESFYGNYGVAWDSWFPWVSAASSFNIYDVSAIESITKSHDIDIEGGFVESRRVGDDIIVVTRHMPTIDSFVSEPFGTGETAVRANLEALTVNDLLPSITINGVSSPLVDATDCFVADQALVGEQYYYPVVTTISRIPISDPSSLESVCLSEDTSGLYMSSTAIYLTQSHGDYSTPWTRVHKFAFDDTSIDYKGSGDVEGYIWTSGQADFRMNEYEDKLRMVTTTYTGDSHDSVDYQVHILEESSTETALTTISTLPNNTQTAEIGKPNEQLYGVRFFGEKAYLVTFERIDPLYVLDLSDPSEPFIAGELEIPGVSEFLHPVSDDLLLGLGNAGQQDWRVKFELFDVSDIAAPVSQSIVYFGNQGEYSHSEAVYDRHAFSYLAGDTVDRLTIPVNISGDQYLTALHMLEIRDKDQASQASIVNVGYISSGERYYYGASRGVMHDDAVYYISGGFVWSAPWATTDQQVGPQ